MRGRNNLDESTVTLCFEKSLPTPPPGIIVLNIPFSGHFDANGQFVQQLQPQPVAIPVAQPPAPKDDNNGDKQTQMQSIVQIKEEQNLHSLQPPKQPQLTTLQNATRFKSFQVLGDQPHNIQHAQPLQYQHVQLQQPQHLVAPGQLGLSTIIQTPQLQTLTPQASAQNSTTPQTQTSQHQQAQLQLTQQQPTHAQQQTLQQQQPLQQQQQPTQQQQQQQTSQLQTTESTPVGYTIVTNPESCENSPSNETALAIVGDGKGTAKKKGAKGPKTEKKYACDFCDGKDFRSRGNLKRHQKDFHLSAGCDKVTYHCDLCKKDFQNRFNLRRHRLGVHGAFEQDAKTYPCDICKCWCFFFDCPVSLDCR